MQGTNTQAQDNSSPLLHKSSVSITLPSYSIKAGKENIVARVATITRRPSSRVLNWYIPTDIIAMVMGFFAAWAMASIVNHMLMGRAVADVVHYAPRRMTQFGLIAAGVLVWFQHTSHYRMRMPFWAEAKQIVTAMGFAMMLDGFVEFAVKEDFSRLWLISGWAVAALFMIALRSILRAQLRKRHLFQIPTLLIGSGETAQHTREALKTEPDLGYEIIAQVKDLPSTFMQAGKSWEKLYALYNVQHIIIALDGHELTRAERPLAQLARESLPFSVSPALRHMPVHGMVPQYFFNHDVMLMTQNSGLQHPLRQSMKRAMDIIVSATALIVLSPIMLAVAWMTRRDGGPALYGHSRLGRNNTSFACLKFRSMVINGDEVLKEYLASNASARAEWASTRKLQNDPRVTKIGKFLRKSSLDELPQLLNVLRGEMSLVGPRPIVTAEVSKYEGDIAHYYRVRPGITGLWQVSGRNDVTYGQRVHMDSWYVRNWSLWHDIAIMFKTIPALLKRSGAY
jgi:undecaprenyl-phosphate galactose phosphotransferase